MRLQTKLIVLCAFASRLPIIAFVIIRLSCLNICTVPLNPPLELVASAIWTQIHLNYSIIACTIFSLKPFTEAVSTNYGTAGAQTFDSGNNTNNSSGTSGSASCNWAPSYQLRDGLQPAILPPYSSKDSKRKSSLSTSISKSISKSHQEQVPLKSLEETRRKSGGGQAISSPESLELRKVNTKTRILQNKRDVLAGKRYSAEAGYSVPGYDSVKSDYLAENTQLSLAGSLDASNKPALISYTTTASACPVRWHYGSNSLARDNGTKLIIKKDDEYAVQYGKQ
ncbi:hypothetical protein FQN57_003080 [Myotisia sp. PD_48]|nr:hypothetical protein FQN57_003080 [Myotisia sp. PD_48]